MLVGGTNWRENMWTEVISFGAYTQFTTLWFLTQKQPFFEALHTLIIDSARMLSETPLTNSFVLHIMISSFAENSLSWGASMITRRRILLIAFSSSTKTWRKVMMMTLCTKLINIGRTRGGRHVTLVSTVLTLGHQSRNIFCAFSCILSDYISLFHEMDKFSVPRIVRYGVGRATKYRPYKIMSSSLVTSLMFFTDRLPFLITTLATTFMIHSRPITNYEYLRLPNSVFSPMNSVWHYVTPFTGKAPISLCLFIYKLLIQSARIFRQMVLLAILNIALGALTIAT